MHAIEHDPQKQRFTMNVEGQECVVDYRLNGSVMTITHTGVPDALSGRGLAAQITRHVLEFAQARHLQVVPLCSYAAAYIQRHPEYSNLLFKPS